jgi:hypothetical protein
MMSLTSIDQALPSIEDLTRRPAWMKRGACRGEDPAMFFPTRGVSAAAMAKARAICAGCPVRAECLAYASATAHSQPNFLKWDRHPARFGKTLRVAYWTGGRPKSNILDWRTDK